MGIWRKNVLISCIPVTKAAGEAVCCEAYAPKDNVALEDAGAWLPAQSKTMQPLRKSFNIACCPHRQGKGRTPRVLVLKPEDGDSPKREGGVLLMAAACCPKRLMPVLAGVEGKAAGIAAEAGSPPALRAGAEPAVIPGVDVAPKSDGVGEYGGADMPDDPARDRFILFKCTAIINQIYE